MSTEDDVARPAIRCCRSAMSTDCKGITVDRVSDRKLAKYTTYGENSERLLVRLRIGESHANLQYDRVKIGRCTA